jgi:hypothetical protein
MRSGELFKQTFTGMFYSSMIPPVRMEVMVYACDEAYAVYHNKLSGFNFAFAGNPFAEPSIAYTNIQGGAGILGSINTSSVQIFNLP